jgi:hypothetical protein
MYKRIEKTDEFKAVSDEGNEYLIAEYQGIINMGSMKNPNAEAKGLKWLKTSNGFAVNYIDADTFKIVETDEIVRKV